MYTPNSLYIPFITYVYILKWINVAKLPTIYYFSLDFCKNTSWIHTLLTFHIIHTFGMFINLADKGNLTFGDARAKNLRWAYLFVWKTNAGRRALITIVFKMFYFYFWITENIFNCFCKIRKLCWTKLFKHSS